MTSNRIILFILFFIAYMLAEKAFDVVKFNIREVVESRLLRILIIIVVFGITVFFNMQWRETNFININTLFYTIGYGISLNVLIQFVWSKRRV